MYEAKNDFRSYLEQGLYLKHYRTPGAKDRVKRKRRNPFQTVDPEEARKQKKLRTMDEGLFGPKNGDFSRIAKKFIKDPDYAAKVQSKFEGLGDYKISPTLNMFSSVGYGAKKLNPNVKASINELKKSPSFYMGHGSKQRSNEHKKVINRS